MKIRELMSSPAVSVEPDTSLHDVARLLAVRHLSGLPVVSDGHVLGVVSQSDLVRRASALETESTRSHLPWHRRPESPAAPPTTAGEAMTSPAAVVEDWMSVCYAAYLMTTLDVERLPVVHGDTLVGVISRSDVVRHCARRDEEIREEVERAVYSYDPLEAELVHVVTHDGRVTLEGETEHAIDLESVPKLAARVPGVVDVSSHLHVRDQAAA